MRRVGGGSHRRLKLALTFGLIGASSAASIAWAFISPNAAGEISSIDFFNLLWAGIAMLIAFTAFLVCFELPRGEDMFAAFWGGRGQGP